MNLSFQISSKILPINHNFLLKNALCKFLDCGQKNLAICEIGVANGNGWEQDKNDFFHPSKRTKLTIRLAKKI